MRTLQDLPRYEDIEAAAERLRGQVAETPLLESDLLNRSLGGRLLVKAECLQRVGAFKFRGAYNAINSLPEAERRRGVVAYSSGNHAQAVALAARILGLRAVIIMPADAPVLKISNTRAYGADVITYNRAGESREAIAERVRAETGAVLIPPFDHPDVIAGQGTVGLEIMRDCRPDAVLVPCSGGGLTAGCALAIRHASPETEIFAVEPEGYEDTRLSLEAGQPVTIQPDRATLCDALALTRPGELTFEINRRLVTGALAVPDREVLQAMRQAFESFKLVLEPGGAAALAAVLAGKVPVKDRTVVVIASGGNVDPAVFRCCLELAD